MDIRLLELFSANKRSCEHFSKYFTDAGLKELSDFARNRQAIGSRKELQKELQEQMERGDAFKDQYSRLLKAFTSQGASGILLLVKMQEYCYDNIHFMNSFQKIVVLPYKADVLSEEAILKWYTEAHVAKGRSVFLEQMKMFGVAQERGGRI